MSLSYPVWRYIVNKIKEGESTPLIMCKTQEETEKYANECEIFPVYRHIWNYIDDGKLPQFEEELEKGGSQSVKVLITIETISGVRWVLDAIYEGPRWQYRGWECDENGFDSFSSDFDHSKFVYYMGDTSVDFEAPHFQSCSRLLRSGFGDTCRILAWSYYPSPASK